MAFGRTLVDTMQSMNIAAGEASGALRTFNDRWLSMSAQLAEEQAKITERRIKRLAGRK